MRQLIEIFCYSRAITNDAVVAGGGAIEMELSKILRDHSRSIAGKEQLIFAAMARAFECIPRQLCDNAGFDATNILNKLRQKHAQVCEEISYYKEESSLKILTEIIFVTNNFCSVLMKQFPS